MNKETKKVTVDDVRENFGVKDLPSEMNKGIMFFYHISGLLKSDTLSYGNTKFDFDVFLPDYGINLQRPYVWEECQQVSFIENIILEKPVGEFIAVVEEDDFAKSDGNRVYKIIDGKQRLLTIHKFLHNEFPIVVGGEKVYYDDFSDELKRFFEGRVDYLSGSVYYSDRKSDRLSDRTLIQMFNYYNFSGTPQTKQHKDMLMGLLQK
jgi:hypothetical protein